MTTGALTPQLGFLRRFVEASGWHGSDIAFVESAPHLAQDMAADEYLATLRNMGLPLSIAAGRISDLAAGDCPAMHVGADGTIRILLDIRDGMCLQSLPTDATPNWVKAAGDRGTFIRIDDAATKSRGPERQDVAEIARGFKGHVGALLFASLVTNLMALSTPLLIMVIYDRVIPTGSVELLVAMVLAMTVVFGTDLVLRMIRVRAVAHMGAAMEGRLGMALFRKLASIPLSEVQKSEVDQQIARLKQFEGMRDLFAGPVFTTLLDIPFIAIFIAALFILSPAIGLLIVIAAALFALLAVLSAPKMARLNAEAAQDRTVHQQFLFESMQNQRAVTRLGLGPIWRERHRKLSVVAADSTRRAREFQLSCQALGQSMMTVSGVGAIFLGTHMAMAGNLSFGALIAIMSLVWKTLAPIHALYTNLQQIQGFSRSRNQIDRVLALPDEFVRRAALGEFKSFKGAVSMVGVTHRFAQAQDASLSQVSLDIAPGECVLITGANGSGKTVLLDLVDGLFSPSAGAIHLDAVNYRQIAVDDLRHMISYQRQDTVFFHGTIWQNFQLAAPMLSRADVLESIAAMELENELAHLPDGIDTRLSEALRRTLPAATLRGLALARCLGKSAAVYLLDDPASGLDPRRREALVRWIERIKGRRTVLLASDRIEHRAIADRFVFLDQGRVVVNDTGETGRRKIAALLARQKEEADV